MSEDEETNDIVDTTDCLEAAGAFKGMKNFLFAVVIISLLVLQAIFWLDNTGYIDKADSPCPAEGSAFSRPGPVKLCSSATYGRSLWVDNLAAVVKKKSAETKDSAKTIDKQAGLVTEDVSGSSEQPDEAGSTEPDTAGQDKGKISKILMIKCSYAVGLIKAGNFIVILAGMLYVLMLLMTIKISLAGRLGGINHISRAFFLSLFGFVILLPWQVLFPNVIVGAIYTPKELLCPGALSPDGDLASEIFYYLRFSGLWLIVVLLFLGAQIRSIRWSKATLRRLGIIE